MINLDDRKFVVLTLQAFLDGTGGAWDFDDLVHNKLSDDLAQATVNTVRSIPLEHPSADPNAFCSHEGFRKIQELVDQLRASIN